MILRIMIPVIVLVSLAVIIAPVPNSEPGFYYSTSIGSQWVYQSGDFVDKETITKTWDRDDGKEIEISTGDEGNMTVYGRLLVSNKGIRIISIIGADDIIEPLWILKLSDVKDNKWNTIISVPQGTWGGISTISKPERIEVPAGTYDAVCVTYKGSAPGRDTLTRSQWFAKSVGIVKEDYNGKVKVLKSFKTK